MREHAKIIATIGPASSSPKALERMVSAGMDIARLNFSHGTHEEHAETVRRIRAVERRTGRFIGVLADMGGPKIRTGLVPGGDPIELRKGAKVIFAPEGKARGDEVPISFPGLARDLKPGSMLLIDDGAISVRVTRTRGAKIETKVETGGPLHDHKGINLPGLVLSTSALTPKDERDLRFALSIGVDFIGLSFCQSAADIKKARGIMRRAKRQVPIVAKIERQIAVSRLEEIVGAADAAMVARGDLGVEIPLQDVPVVQKRIISTCAAARKPVVVATQMLESMIHSARPTRAEATDVSNAVFEGADAVMLSAETSIGADPINAVRTMAEIVGAAEDSPYIMRRTYVPDESDRSVELATARAACFAAEEAGARAICVFTQTGRSARMVSAQRPGVGIVAITESEDAARHAQIYWGVTPLCIGKWRAIDSMLKTGLAALKKARLISSEDTIVAVAGSTPVAGATNMIKVLEV